MPTTAPTASHAHIVETLGLRIAGGTLAPGAGMTVAALEQEFSASRTVVREAVRVLEAHGLLRSRRRVGLVVRPREEWDSLDATVMGRDVPKRAGCTVTGVPGGQVPEGSCSTQPASSWPGTRGSVTTNAPFAPSK